MVGKEGGDWSAAAGTTPEPVPRSPVLAYVQQLVPLWYHGWLRQALLGLNTMAGRDVFDVSAIRTVHRSLVCCVLAMNLSFALGIGFGSEVFAGSPMLGITAGMIPLLGLAVTAAAAVVCVHVMVARTIGGLFNRYALPRRPSPVLAGLLVFPGLAAPYLQGKMNTLVAEWASRDGQRPVVQHGDIVSAWPTGVQVLAGAWILAGVLTPPALIAVIWATNAAETPSLMLIGFALIAMGGLGVAGGIGLLRLAEWGRKILLVMTSMLLLVVTGIGGIQALLWIDVLPEAPAVFLVVGTLNALVWFLCVGMALRYLLEPRVKRAMQSR